MFGQTISHYRITEKLGEGGMGVAYKAEDTKLERPVALKFLPAHLLGNDEIRKRFEREAKAAAALHHPNICPVYEIDEVEGTSFISMAFIDGESLAQKIAKGPLKLKQALDIAQQIAQGLQAAHEKGIFHRDIKPENIIVDSKGHATVMDFGLAQLTEASRLTRADETMGTVAYMSPEQTDGSGTDHRTDVWSLGVVLYEMITGQQPFKGDYDKAVMYSILNEAPEPITSLRTGVPLELEWLVNKCLSKQGGSRYQQIGDLLVDLNRLGTNKDGNSSTTVPVAQTPAQQVAESEKASAANPELWARQKKLRAFQLISTVLALLALTLGTFVFFESQEQGAAPVRRFSFESGPLDEWRLNRAVISPNGQHIVYVAAGEKTKLWLRDLASEEVRPLESTESSYAPFWSPDSDFIGFGTTNIGGIGGELKKISVRGGPSVTLCDLNGNYGGGAWSPDGASIVYTSGALPRLREVSSMGGSPRLLVEPDEATVDTFSWQPHFLPPDSGKRLLLFTIGGGSAPKVAVQDLETGSRKILAAGAKPVYSPSGHILYQTDYFAAGIWVVPFSVEAVEVTGDAFPIAERLGEPSLATDGTLVAVSTRQRHQLVWRDRKGNNLGTIGQPRQHIQYPSLSPDGRYVAMRGLEQGLSADVWIVDLTRSIARRLTFDPEHDSRPIWSASGNEITFASRRRGNYDVFIRPVNGGDGATPLTSTERAEVPGDWSSDGRFLVFDIRHPDRGHDISYLQKRDSDGGFDEVPFLETEFDEKNPKISPDGRFVAYQSDESGRVEIYVKPFPGGEGKWPVSRNGGISPRWSRDGDELFYVEENTLMAVPVEVSPEFSAGEPSRLFSEVSLARGNYHNYDVSLDGQKFVVVEDVDMEAGRIHVVQNWYEEFRDRAQD